MVYMGSKARLADELVPIIQGYIDESNPLAYIEPFVGGANVIDKIKHDKRIGFDNNKYLIALLQNPDKVAGLSLDPLPREEYNRVRAIYRAGNPQQEEEDWYIGAVGFFASFNGRFYDGGYGISAGRNEWSSRIRNYLGQLPQLKQINFQFCDFSSLPIVSDCVIYCDPPYQGTKLYDTSKHFDYPAFWQKMRELSLTNIVLVSELQAPEDFEVIWEKGITYTMNSNARKSAQEKLFRYSGGR